MPCLIEDADSTVPVRVYAWGSDAADYSATQAFVKCFNGDTGELLWTSDPITSIGYTVSYGSWHSIAADKTSGRIFLGMGAHLYCYDALSGAPIWQSDPLRADSGEGLVVNATVTVGSQFVYQSTYTGFGGSCYLQAFNITDGKEAWVDVRAGQGQETVVYHEDGVRSYLYRMISSGSYSSGGAGVVCLDAEDGSLVWSSENPLDGSPAWWTGAGNVNFGGITFHDGLILAPTYNFSAPSDFVCLDAYTGALKWLASGTAPNTDGAPVVVGDRVYVTGHYFYGDTSYLVGFDLHTGQKVYERKVSTDSNMWNVSASATNDRVYVTEGSAIFSTNSKGLHMLYPDRDDMDATSITALTERIRGSVAIGTDGAVYGFLDTDPPSMLGGLVCYRVPEANTIRFLDQDVPTTDSYTCHPEITVLHQARWATEMRVYEAGETPGEWKPYAASSTWTLSSGEGNKTLYAEYRNGSGEAQGPVTGSIWVGTPRIPGESVTVRDQDGDMPQGHTNARPVVVEVLSEGATEILIRETEEGGTWQNYSRATLFTLTPEFDTKTLYVKLRNPLGESQEYVCQIELHTSPYAAEVV
ncbi:MAG TPA: PQQ-binding-like beta-propeller repeat protein, partial [Candidatus Sumerlaeota bacterium]|nr:PQQ-binding-like beta-propeller repeat protein [Candidatus Sumerlaeota bacterium]